MPGARVYFHAGRISRMGRSPLVADANVFAPVVANGFLQFNLPISKTATDVQLVPEWSADLVQWFSGPSLFVELDRSDAGGAWLTTQRLTTPVAGNGAGFVRVRAAR
jgi:hypothetical protein